MPGALLFPVFTSQEGTDASPISQGEAGQEQEAQQSEIQTHTRLTGWDGAHESMGRLLVNQQLIRN